MPQKILAAQRTGQTSLPPFMEEEVCLGEDSAGKRPEQQANVNAALGLSLSKFLKGSGR